MGEATIHDVASYILDKYESGISTMKLQKLCFFAQGWALALLGKPLFSEQFQAWKNGPVSYELFDQHRGMYAVQDWKKGDAGKLSSRQKVILDAVLSNYGALSGLQLSDLTHKSGTPWASARRRVGATDGSFSQEPIQNEEMRQYFVAKLSTEGFGA